VAFQAARETASLDFSWALQVRLFGAGIGGGEGELGMENVDRGATDTCRTCHTLRCVSLVCQKPQEESCPGTKSSRFDPV